MVFYYVYNGFVKFIILVMVLYEKDKDKFGDGLVFGFEFQDEDQKDVFLSEGIGLFLSQGDVDIVIWLGDLLGLMIQKSDVFFLFGFLSLFYGFSFLEYRLEDSIIYDFLKDFVLLRSKVCWVKKVKVSLVLVVCGGQGYWWVYRKVWQFYQEELVLFVMVWQIFLLNI